MAVEPAAQPPPLPPPIDTLPRRIAVRSQSPADD